MINMKHKCSTLVKCFDDDNDDNNNNTQDNIYSAVIDDDNMQFEKSLVVSC